MAVNLQVHVDPSRAEEGFQKIAQAAAQAADVAEKASESSKDAAIKSLDEQIEKVKELQRETTELAKAQQAAGADARRAGDVASDAADKASESARRAAGSVQDAKQEAESVLDTAVSLSSAWEYGKAALEAVVELVDALAEHGNPAAVELKSSFDDLKETLFEIAEDNRFQEILQSSAEIIKDDLIPAVKYVGDLCLDGIATATDAAANLGTYFAETFGIVEEGAYDALLADQRRAAEALANAGKNRDAARREAAAVESIQAAKQELAKFEQQKATAVRRAHLQEIADVESLRGRIGALTADLMNQNTTHERRLEIVGEIKEVEGRILEIGKEQDRAKEAEERRQQNIKAALEELHSVEEDSLETQSQKRERLLRLIEDSENGLRGATMSERETTEVINRMLGAKRELLQIQNEIAKESEAEAQRRRDVAAEIKRIDGMEVESAARERQTRGDLVKVMDEARKKLQDQNLTQDEQNKLLRQMEDTKRRIMTMDKEAAAAEKQRADSARRTAEDEKKRFAESEQGKQAMAAAASPEAIARRIATDTGRKVGTVRQMMARGDISQEDLTQAAQQNFQDAFQGSVQATRQSVDISREVAGAMERVVGEQANLGTEMADVRQQVRTLWRFLESNAESGRRRRASANSA